MFKRLAEKLFGLDPGYFDQPGEIGRHWFDPHWPGPLFGSAGSWHNYLLAIFALLLLLFLFRRAYRARLERSRIWLAIACTIGVPLAVIAQAGTHAWSILLLLIAAAAVGYLLYRRNTKGLLIAGRLAVFAF